MARLGPIRRPHSKTRELAPQLLQSPDTDSLSSPQFSISHDGAWLSVGNQGTGNVVIFARGNDGTLTKTAELAAPSLKGVAFAGFAPAHHK